MKKIILTLVTAILLAILGIVGLNYMKDTGPRGRVVSPSGSTIIVEEMSYYIKGEKIFGKIFKPADANGNFSDSLGPLPLVMFFHEPLKTEWPESLTKALVSKGLVGYTCGFRGDEKDIEAIVKRVSKERFVEDGLVFLVGDSSCGNEIVKASSRLGHRLQGLVLVEPALSGKARETYVRYGQEFLTITENTKGNSATLIEDYLEERGALK